MTRSASASSSSTSTNQHDVIVVGGGLVGATFALGCAQAGLDVALVAGRPAAVPSFSDEIWDRRVYAISPASQRFLQALKLWPQINPERLSPVRDMRIFGVPHESGQDASSLHFSSYQAGTDALAWIIEHRELTRVVDTALGFQQGLTRIDADAEAIEPGVDFTTVKTARGAMTAKLLVGADGARSKVRELLAWDSETKPYGQTGVVANFSCARAHGGTAFQWFTQQGIVALLPLPNQATSLVWSAPEALAQELLGLTPEDLAQRIEQIAGDAVGSLTPLSGASGFPLQLLTTRRQVGPRSVLIGDAAHVVHPLAGQGLNLGLQDAEALCQILRERERFRDSGDAVLLRRYERARKAPVWAMRQATDGLQRLFATDDAMLSTVRRLGMNFVNQMPIIKRALIRQAMG